MDYVKRIASSIQNVRKEAIFSILNENKIPFIKQRVLQGEHWVENIIVSCNPSSSRLVIGAHYDSIEGSTGANDNAAGVSVLLKVIKNLFFKTDLSIDFVFFDREEYIDHGSEAYISEIGKDNISAMINLDVCGYGEFIAVSHKGNKGNPLFINILQEHTLQKHCVTLLNYLPNGDDDRFQDADIPNISIAVLGESDLIFFNKISDKIKNNESLTEKDNEELMSLDIVSTMHLGINDNISIISQKSMDILLSYLLDGLNS